MINLHVTVLVLCSVMLHVLPIHVGRVYAAPEKASETTEASEPGADAEAFRKVRPEASKPRDFNLPQVQSFKLNNGMNVYLLEDHSLPTISARMDFNGGAYYDPQDKGELASVCMELLTRGTKKHDFNSWKVQLRNLAVSIEGQGYKESVGISISTLSENLEAAFLLLSEAILEPGLRQDEFERLIKLRLAELQQTKSSADSVARRVGASVLYGLDHPLGRVATEGDLEKLKVTDCAQLLSRMIKPDGAQLLIVGDITRQQIEAQEIFKKSNKWSGKGLDAMIVDKPKDQEGKIFFVHVPGSEQSFVGLKDFGPERKAADYIPTMLMSNVLGGGFTSRINMNLREDKGYSYGAYGGFYYNKFFGEFAAGTSVRTDATYQSVLELFSELGGLEKGTKSVTDVELNREKNSAILGLPGKFATSSQALSMYSELLRFGLPLDYYNGFVKQVDTIGLEQVVLASKKYIKSQGVKILVVGDGDKLVNVRNGGKDEPLLVNGKPVTMLESLKKLITDQLVTGKSLIILDADGKRIQKLDLRT